MLVRRKSRILALMMLFSLEQQESTSIDTARSVFSVFSPRLPQGAEDYALHLLHGVLESRDTYDAWVKKHIRNWDYDRLPLVDRQILRIALFEIEHEKNSPVPVIINEAIDISKIFSTAESPSFINGVLDAIIRKTKQLNKKWRST